MPYTLLMLVITVVPVVVTFLTVRTLMLGFLVWLLLGVSLIVWLNSLLLRRVFLVFEDIETSEKSGEDISHINLLFSEKNRYNGEQNQK